MLHRIGEERRDHHRSPREASPTPKHTDRLEEREHPNPPAIQK